MWDREARRPSCSPHASAMPKRSSRLRPSQSRREKLPWLFALATSQERYSSIEKENRRLLTRMQDRAGCALKFCACPQLPGNRAQRLAEGSRKPGSRLGTGQPLANLTLSGLTGTTGSTACLTQPNMLAVHTDRDKMMHDQLHATRLPACQMSAANRVRSLWSPAQFPVPMPCSRRAAACAVLPLVCLTVHDGLVTAWTSASSGLGERARTTARTATRSSELAARTRYVPGRRLGGKRQDTAPPYVPEGNNRRKIAWLLILSGLAGYQAGNGFLEERYETNSAPEFAYSSPVIQQGCVLMARPGDTFIDHQQYFHKSAILILKHNADFDRGIIINRPSGFNTRQLGVPGPAWNIWFGGDCEGLRAPHYTGVRTFCLHVSDEFAEMSKEVERGVYLIRFDAAQDLVANGRATTDDFMLFFGYCGWSRNQLQRELDAGVWKMVSWMMLRFFLPS